MVHYEDRHHLRNFDRPLTGLQNAKSSSFMQPKGSLGTIAPLTAMQSVFKQFSSDEKEVGENSSRLLTERSSAVFGGNGGTKSRLQESAAEEQVAIKRPPMFPSSDAEEEEDTKTDFNDHKK